MINSYDLMVAHPETFRSLSVKDMLFVHYTCPQVEKQINAWSEYNIIGFTLNGKKIYHQGGKTWILSEDNTLFSKKGAFTQEKYKYGGWEVMAFYIPDEYLKKVFNEYRRFLPLKDLPENTIDPMIELAIDDRIRSYFFSILTYFNHNGTSPEDLIELKFRELLFNIYSNPINRMLLAYVSGLVDQYKTPLWQIMESNFMFNLSISEYSRLSQRSVSTFKRDFNSVYKTTPGKWLINKRLGYAKDVLESSMKSINEIAYESGFENSSHFSRVFKEKHMMTPVQYRQHHKNLIRVNG
jgi:AraC-like DNA-binding protein